MRFKIYATAVVAVLAGGLLQPAFADAASPLPVKAQAAAITSATVSSAPISSSYFGDHILGPLETNLAGSGVATVWPSWSPTTIRLLNTYGYNSSKGVYENISWADINTANGVYSWTLFDALLAKFKARGVTDLVYTFINTPTWAGGGANNDAPPSSNQYLSNFATAVARRAITDGFPIKSWETWNEPSNGAGTWTGTTAQMVAMAQTIYRAVKAVDPSCKVLTPSPQGNATTWMNGYLAAGGGAYADIMSFHGYTFSTPETIATLIDSYKKVFATYGQSTKPIWDTEAMDYGTSDPTLQARFLAVYYLLQQAKGVSRFYWYAYDADQGAEWFYTAGQDAVGLASVQIHNWMLGATSGALSQSGTVYSVPLTKGTQTLAVWNSAGTSAYATGSYTKYTDLKGVVHAISGGRVNIGQDPILLSAPGIPTFANGSFVRAVENGRVYRIVGGAPLWLSSCVDRCVGLTNTTQSVIDRLPAVPANGTFLRAVETSRVYRVAGGAPLWLSSCVDKCAGYVNIDQWTVNTLDHLRAYPADGTLLNAVETRRVYQVAGGIPTWLRKCPAQGCVAMIRVDQWTIDTRDHLR